MNLKRESRTKRRAASGVLSSMMLFSMIFTVGAGYFLFVINGDSTYNQALLGKTTNLQSRLGESLTVTPALGASNHLVFTATNGGGLAANMTDVFVVDPGGVTHGYGVGFGSNTTPALPGGVTPQKTSVSYDTGLTVVAGTYAIKVITHRGNAYTATYPPAPTNYASSTGSLTVDLSSFKWVQLTGTSSITQENYVPNCNAALCAASFSSSVTSGDTIVYAVGWPNHAAPATPTDTRGDTFTLGASNTVTAAGGITPPTLVQSKYTSNCASSSCGLAFTSNVVSGNTLAFALGWFGQSPPSTPTDTRLDTFTLGVSNTVASAGSSGSPSVVQSRYTSNCASSSCGLGFTSSVTSGNTLVFGLGWFAATPSCALALDGSASGSAQSSQPVSVTLTTSCSPDVVYVAVSVDAGTISTPTASGLTFSLRATKTSPNGVGKVATYYAIASTVLSSKVISETASGQTGTTVIAWGISGANTASPFDPNASIPATAASTGQVSTVSISTSLPNDFILGANVDNSPGEASTAPSPFALIATLGYPSGGGYFEGSADYETVSSTQTNLAVKITGGADVSNWAMIGDAIQATGIAIDNTATSTASADASGNVAISFTVGTGTNRLLVVAGQVDNVATTGVTYGGTALTQAVADTQKPNTAVWYLKNPTSGTATVAISSGSGGANKGAAFGVVSFTGVDQTTPIPTTAKNDNAGGSSSPATVSITNANAGAWVMDVVGSGHSGGFTNGASTTTQWDLSASGNSGASSRSGPLAASTVNNFSWTLGTSDTWNDLAVEIKPSVAGSPLPSSVTDSLSDSFTLGVSNMVVSGSNTYYSYIWYGTAGSSATDTITATFSAAVTGSVSINELSGLLTAGQLTSTGSSSSGTTTPTVSPFTPNANSVVIGNSETASSSSAFTAGSGYTLVGSCSAGYGCGEYRTGVGSSTAVPFTLGSSAPWVESAISFTPSAGSTYYSYIWYATAVSSGADTITASFSSAVTGSVSVYEISGAATANSLTSTGSSRGGSTTPSVGSFTPSANSFVIGNAETGSASSSFTAGSGYTLSGTCSSAYGCGEYQTGVSSTMGVPFTLGVSATWVESAISFSPSNVLYYSYIWYATAISTGSDTITASFGSAVTGSVSIYDMAGYTTAGLLTSLGSSSAGSTTASVPSFTPSANSIVIANVETPSSSISYAAGAGYNLVTNFNCNPSAGCGEYRVGLGYTTTALMTLSSSIPWVESAISFASGATYQSGLSQGGYPTTGLPNDVSIVFQETFTNQDPQGRSVTLWPQSALAVIAVQCSGGGDEGACGGEEGVSNMHPYFIIDGINGGVNGIVAYNSTKNFITLAPGVKTTLYFGARRPLGSQPTSIEEDLQSLFMAFFALTGQYGDSSLYGQTIPYPIGIVTASAASTAPTSGATGASVTVTGSGFNSGTKAFIEWIDSTGRITNLKTFTTDGSGNVPAGTTFLVPSASAGFYTIMVSDYTNTVFRTFQHT